MQVTVISSEARSLYHHKQVLLVVIEISHRRALRNDNSVKEFIQCVRIYSAIESAAS
jgi:hypothetical protein